jgi:hyaluronan synthase
MAGHAPVLAIFFVADIVLPFLLVGTIAGWVYRAVSHTGTNLYAAALEAYTGLRGWAWVLGLMVASSVLSMAIRQIRHLHEKPGDFLRLPVFIVWSTVFLMPVRLLGFLRMAHVSSWGTRAGAYSGTDPIAELEHAPAAPVDLVDRTPPRGVPMAPDEPGAPVVPDEARGTTAVAVRRRRTAVAATVQRRVNPLAATPYAIAAGLLALEALAYV